MSDNGNKKTALLLGSVAANIFLAAFVLGRWSSPGLMPPPPPMFLGREQAMQGQMMPGQMPGQMPPDAMRGPPPGMMGGGPPPGGPGMGMMMNGHAGPGDLFSPQEMQQNMHEMQDNFEKVQSLQLSFAAKLERGGVTKEEALRHFTEVDSIMDSLKTKMREKTAEKIASMSEEERKNFAQHLKQRGGLPQGMPGQGQGPGPGQGQMPGQPGGPQCPGGPEGAGFGGMGGPPPGGGGQMQGQLPPPQ